MNKDNEYRENATECERMARLTRDKADKRTWLDMAQHWRGLISVPPGGAKSQRIEGGIERARVGFRAPPGALEPTSPSLSGGLRYDLWLLEDLET